MKEVPTVASYLRRPSAARCWNCKRVHLPRPDRDRVTLVTVLIMSGATGVSLIFGIMRLLGMF